ncbi:MAG: hypothetical protein R3E73_11145 [Porticoccaceae bacterium]
MNTSTRYTRTALALVASSLTAIHSFAAEENPQTYKRLDEIIVTAKKRSQSINDVGMSISALSGDSLQRDHIVNLEDLSLAVPGLSYANSANNSLFTRCAAWACRMLH